MPRITYVEPGGRRVEAEIDSGLSVMQGAMDLGIDGIEAQCGGMCSCATCHCYVAPEWLARLPPPQDDELVMLQNVAAERRPNSRLSCQLKMTPALDGLLVEYPDRQS
jgi:ferredoxin, 2Fe-2S